MKIIKFRAEKVNGYLNFDIDFGPSLTFLIGINGSGKTTALKLILGLLSPSWINITQIKYTYAEVECEVNGEKIIIRSEYQDSDKIKLSIIFNNIDKKNINNIVRFQDIPTMHVGDYNRFEMRQMMSKYSRYESIFTDLDAVKYIKTMATPAFLGLDRRIHDGTDIDLVNIDSFIKERDITTDIKGNLYESLIDVENLIKTNYLEYSQKQATISASLKNKIIYSSFDVIQGREDLSTTMKINIDVESRKKRIIEASKNFEIPDLELKIINYFNELNRIQKTLEKEQRKKSKEASPEFLNAMSQWFINSPQLERIDTIISLYEAAQNEIVNDYMEFTKFEFLANLYFSENNKQLQIRKNGEITIHLPDKEPSSIYKLSSGEKQVIVMLAQLIFGKKREIFIIDEPELSLHLGWQEIFVKTILDASPETQFILATHSPSIIGRIDNEKYCVDLTPNSN